MKSNYNVRYSYEFMSVLGDPFRDCKLGCVMLANIFCSK